MKKRSIWMVLVWVLYGGISGYGQPVQGGPPCEQADLQERHPRRVMNPAENQDTVLWRIGMYLEQLRGEMEGEVEGLPEKGEVQQAMAYEHFEQLLERPLAINRASRRELEELLILSDFQINSLLAYRRDHGPVLSVTELSLLNGFNERIAGILKYFVMFDAVDAGVKSNENFLRDCRSVLLLKTGITLERTGQGWMFPEEEWPRPQTKAGLLQVPSNGGAVSPVYAYLRYGCNYLNRVQVGITLENDAGERVLGPWKIPLSDFFSFHAAFKQLRIGKVRAEVILGDFSARFGQGLTLWKAFRLNGVSSPSGLYKRGASATAYTSSGEGDFLRGAAVFAGQDFASDHSGSLRGWEVTGVISYNNVDARISDGKYTSVIQGGLHRSESELKNRKTMHETLAGIHAVLLFSRWKAGVSWTTYGYDKPNGRRIEEYNKLQMYDGMWGNFAVDFYAVAGRFRFFGEAALDYGGRAAALLGGLLQAGEMEVGILGRSYGKGYIAPHAGAYSSSSSGCYNQTGFTINFRWNRGSAFALSGNLDITHYPGFRYGVSQPASAIKGFVKGEYKRGGWDGYIRLSESYSTYKETHKIGVKSSWGYRFSTNLCMGMKGEWVMGGKDMTALKTNSPEKEVHRYVSGGAFGVELDYTTKGGIVRIRTGGTWFCAPQWDVRLYCYEAGLPGSYSSVLLYGEGIRGYVTAGVRLFRFCDFYGKASVCGYKKGGGENSLPAPRFKMQLGLKMKF